MAVPNDDQEFRDPIRSPTPLTAWDALALVVALGAFAVIVSTWATQSQTFDEPTHLAAGLQWWQDGAFTLHQENPPLAPVAIAALPHALGYSVDARGRARDAGLVTLYASPSPRALLAWSRAGVIPFFAMIALGVWGWTRRCAGPRAACMGVVLVCTTSPLIGHAGLATTDVPAAALLMAAWFSIAYALEAPNLRRAALVGLAGGTAIAAKLTALVALPVVGMTMSALVLWCRGIRGLQVGRLLQAFVVVVVVAFAVVWASYRFSFGRAVDHPVTERMVAACVRADPGFRRTAVNWAVETRLPAPEFVSGLVWACAHSRRGHPAYLLGEVSVAGFWNFYPLAVGVKTPLVLLLLGLLGTVVGLGSLRGGRTVGRALPVVAAPLVVGIAMTSPVDMGLRHVIVALPMLAIAAAFGADAVIRRFGAIGVGVLVAAGLAHAAGFVSAHPGHQAAFNVLARDPGAILVDSDLDWGQDLWKLEDFFRDRPADRLHIAYWGSAHLCEHSLPPLSWLAMHEPVRGWIAISESYLRGRSPRMYDDPCVPQSGYNASSPQTGYRWLDAHEPVAIIGDSIRVYHVTGP